MILAPGFWGDEVRNKKDPNFERQPLPELQKNLQTKDAEIPPGPGVNRVHPLHPLKLNYLSSSCCRRKKNSHSPYTFRRIPSEVPWVRHLAPPIPNPKIFRLLRVMENMKKAPYLCVCAGTSPSEDPRCVGREMLAGAH
ncbi:hypothetical protein TNCV_3920381 [Trichonephila clavipes]|nr:hypothetical protein TNCV_3920381 [Trichonephila clavipes]